MPSPSKLSTAVFRRYFPATVFVLSFICVLPLATQSSSAQTYSVLHSFTGGNDGASPFSALTLDRAGNLYGTAVHGGDTVDCVPGCGTLFQLKHAGSGWILNSLYVFHGTDGAFPGVAIVFGLDGSLYGTTSGGGDQEEQCFMGCGLVFKLRPPPNLCHSVSCSWHITALYKFQGPPSDAVGGGKLLFDAAGNIYSAGAGGAGFCHESETCGVVYEVSPSVGGWSETILHDFADDIYGTIPSSFLTLDSAGNLYGTARDGGNGAGGSVFKLTPTGNNSPIEVLHFFDFNISFWPLGGVIFDPDGNLFGTTSAGGTGNGGTVFQLAPNGSSWSLSTLYNFFNPGMFDYFGPRAPLTRDADGNLYGTTYADGANQCGSVFKLTHSNGSWSFASLHDFTCGTDGAHPAGGIVLDSAGNVYGTASAGGSQNKGVVFEITP